MPNFDGGHYFLTALIPVRAEPAQDPRGAEWVTSHVHCLREKLAGMPTALQSWATEATGLNSPFARDARTHFARLFVVDDVAYNGRDRRDAIGAALRGALGSVLKRRIPGGDPTVADPVDHLPHPYLVFVCDFDAASGAPAELDGYLRGLWAVMEEEWRDILMHCHGFDRAAGADGFVRLVTRCQVETTMPFNDYYEPFPALPAMNVLPAVAPLLAAVVLLVFGVIAVLVAALFGGRAGMAWLAVLVGLIGVPLGVAFAYRRIVAAGQVPLPTGRRADLVGVTKALYLQQAFTHFAIAQQGRDPAALHAAFGEFLRTHRPDDPLAPTQARGTVRSWGMGATLELADIQGNILAAYGKQGFPKGRTILLHVDDAEAGRNLVETLRRRVTSALPWPTDKRRPIPGQVMAVRPKVAVNLGFTFRGLLALGVPIRTLRGMPDEFIDGMAARADILCDNHPRRIADAWDRVWIDAGKPDRRVHVLITLNTEMDPATGEATPELEQLAQEVVGMCSLGGVRILDGHRGRDPRWQDLSARMKRREDGTWTPLPMEHFGFVDGVADTVFEGQMAEADIADRVHGQGKLLPDGSWAPLATGEFLLGWPDESQEIAGAAMPLDFSRNGTFMAYRKLHQNVFAWRRYMADQAVRFAAVMEVPREEAGPTLAAKIAGRWPDGVPLLAAPTFAAWQDFRARRAKAEREDDAPTIAALKRALVDFTFRADPVGAACPFGAHIRRANTRDMLDPLFGSADPTKLNGSVLNNRRRILRRGLPYGEAPAEGDDSDEHGIVLMAQCASLFRQFEFVQQQWMQYGLDFNAGNDTCPIVGNHFGDAKFVIAADPASGKPPFICAEIPQFVETRGGDYFFIPSLTALRMIAQGLVDPT